jgi:hypothetical protein
MPFSKAALRLHFVGVLFAFAFAFAFTGAQAQSPLENGPRGGLLQLQDAQGQCVSVNPNTITPHSRLVLALPCGAEASVLRITPLGEIRADDRCLAISGANPDPGPQVGGSLVWVACTGTVNMLWLIQGSTIRSQLQGYCLTRTAYAGRSAVAFQMQPCDARDWQNWRWLAARSSKV